MERTQEDRDIRIVHQIKNSLGPSDGEFYFAIHSDSGFEWLECSEVTEKKSEEQPEFTTKAEKAAYLIKLFLKDEDMCPKEIYARLRAEGISYRTAKDLKKDLGIRCYR